MKTIISCLICVLFSGITNTFSQNIRLYASPKGAEVLAPNNKDTLLSPWCGGWVNPQISNIDLNGDNRPDIFVFEPGANGDNRVLTFLNIGNGQFQYAPEYESFFPNMTYWALLVDYNHDGKPDIFTYSLGGAAMDVWKNVSAWQGSKYKLQFKKVTRDYLHCTNQFGQTQNLYVTSAGIPAFADIDGDGDMDILALGVTGNCIEVNTNDAVDSGYSLDSLHFFITAQNWGKISATSEPDTLPFYLNSAFGCGQQMKRNKHGGTTLLAVDMDNDGDMDMLVGNQYDSLLAQLQNGRINIGGPVHKKDTINKETNAIMGSQTVPYIGYFASPYLVNATDDTLKDIVAAPFYQIAPPPFTYNTAPPTHHTCLYKNTGTGLGNHYQLVNDNFLQESMLDYGDHAAPAFVDFNNDGLMDLVVATRGNPDNGYQWDHLLLYKNIGTKDKAVYQKVDDDFATTSKLKLAYLAPTFADIDGDGRVDMLLGTQDGRLMFFKNIADSGGTLQMKKISDNFQNLKFPGFSTPCLAHISNDSLFDLVVGNKRGNIYYYKNAGSATSPLFKQITDSFGHVKTNLFYWYVDTPTDSILEKDSVGMSAPMIADFDHDGKMDMVCGSSYGEMLFYFDITDNLNGKFKRTDTVFYNTLLGAKENKFLGSITMPAAADLNNDGYPELLIGNNMGGIEFYGSKIVKLGIETVNQEEYTEPDFRLYPNPAHHNFNVSFIPKDGYRYNLEIMSTLGKEIYSQRLNEGQTFQNVNVSDISPGVYFVSIHDNKGGAGVRKLVIQ